MDALLTLIRWVLHSTHKDEPIVDCIDAVLPQETAKHVARKAYNVFDRDRVHPKSVRDNLKKEGILNGKTRE